LKTRGEIVGDEIVVNGQKMWTSFAHLADYQELLIRTDPNEGRHRGLTWVICDMKAPGISITPIKNMMGEHHTNMVFYDNVRIPLTNVVGGIGNGWNVAMNTLSIERAVSFLPEIMDMLDKLERVHRLASETRLETGDLAIEDDDIARRLARCRAEALALKAMTLTNLSGLDQNGKLGPESSLAKLYVTTLYRSLAELTEDILGMEFDQYGEDRTSNRSTFEYMWSWILTIAGGSTEIQKEIIADRVLGLPRAR
jgi:alkylation response protein AidB-like acyl-CoA dehydrogenase